MKIILEESIERCPGFICLPMVDSHEGEYIETGPTWINVRYLKKFEWGDPLTLVHIVGEDGYCKVRATVKAISDAIRDASTATVMAPHY